MFFQFLKLQTLKAYRSVSLSRNLIGGIFMAFLTFIFLASLLIIASALGRILGKVIEAQPVIPFLNTQLLYFFLAEVLYRFFVQKLPLIELRNFLHLPIKRSKILHYLLGRSFFTPLSFIAIICFAPISLTHIRPAYSLAASVTWLGTLIGISWSLHWLMLWYKQKFGAQILGILTVFLFSLVTFGANYLNLYNVGNLAAPFFGWALHSSWPLLITLLTFLGGYMLSFTFFKRNSYIEEVSSGNPKPYINSSIDFFSRFGLPGEVADLEWKLILRHKKSRTYLIIAFLFLLYGLVFYGDPTYGSSEGISYFYVFVGVFITGTFMLQYGQLFLSWNSPSFDFYMGKADGLRSLIEGKYLLFLVISVLCLVLSFPYVYFGWEILLVHLACFLFNMGISIHLIIYLSLWKPKPMDLGKGAFFNYEGVGIAQFLMAIPVVAIPYAVFIPAAMLGGGYVGIFVLAAIGLAGIIFRNNLMAICANNLVKNRYQISSSFRQES